MEAENALSLQSTKHPDGWGIGWFVDEDAYVIKSATAAHASERFRKASSRLTSHTFLVHVRKATVGALDHLNAHPFRFGRWLFAHNGTVFGFETIQDWVTERIDPDLMPLILGDTDSEAVFFYLLSCLKRAGIDPAGRVAAAAEHIADVVRASLLALDQEASKRGLERPILNALITDGRSFVAHRAGMPLYLSTQKISCSDEPTCIEPNKFCLHPTRPADTPVNHLIIASEPIATDENIWEEVADGATVCMDPKFFLRWQSPPSNWEAPILPARYQSNPPEA